MFYITFFIPILKKGGYKMKYKFEKNAYSQAYEIVNFLLRTQMEVVFPEEFINVLEKNKNESYKFDLNDINNNTILPDTEKILSVLFSEYLVNETEKKVLQETSQKIRNILVDKKEENMELALITENLKGLSFFKKIIVKINKLIKIKNSELNGNTIGGKII